MNTFRASSGKAALAAAAAIMLTALCGCSGGSADGKGFIRGEVFFATVATAPVYVLAIRYEHRGMLRKIENEPAPVHSHFVAASARLNGPGAFTITGLEDGEYVLWAWMDRNANGAVDHLNFSEPVGWHQSDANLAMNKLTLAQGAGLSGRDITLYQPTPFPDVSIQTWVGSGGGLLKTVKGNKTLVLWGSGPERARAMGRLPGRSSTTASRNTASSAIRTP